MPPATTAEGIAHYKKFAGAPYVHPFNKPKYHAIICHAWHFAKARGKRLYRFCAQDWPLTSEEEHFTSEGLQHLREMAADA